MPLSIGDKLGPYEVLAPIGAGGMGEVFKARDTRLNRIVALKISKLDFGERFEREARAIAALNHPNICQLYDVGPSYLVMEFVDGRPLEGPLPLEKAGAYAIQILDALDAAHRKGITHRDLKPANILVTKQDIKLLDFGLAKQATGLRELDATLTHAVTTPGQIVGSLQYMSPEQLQGKEADERSDLFAFGCVLYELISGRQAFPGASAASVIASILEREPATIDISPPLDRVLRTCLAKDPDERFQTARDLKRALVWALEQSGTAIAERRSMLPWIVAACLGAAAVAFASMWIARVPGSARDQPTLHVDLDLGENVSQPAVSSDGMRIAFTSQGQLAVRRMDLSRVTRLAATAGAQFPFFSPNGEWLAFFAGGKLQKIAIEGGAPITICDAPDARGGSWGEDGNIVAALSVTSGLSRVPVSGGTPQPLTDPETQPGALTSHRWPQVLPGGKGILFTATFAGSRQGALRVLPGDGRAAKTLVQNSTLGRYIPGFLIYYQRRALFAAPFDVNRLELTGPAVALVDDVASHSGTALPEFDVSRSGLLVYRRSAAVGERVLAWLGASGTPERLRIKPDTYLMPRLSPDGKQLALVVDRDEQQNLWIYNLIQETMTRLTFEAERQDNPAWTPDGGFIVLRAGDEMGWVRSDGGSGKVERLHVAFGNAFPRTFSPDGKWLAYSFNDPQTTWDLWTATVERGPLRLATKKPVLKQAGTQIAPAISPDGHWLAYHSTESGRAEIYVMRFSPDQSTQGGKWQISSEGGTWPVWSSNGRELFFRSPDRRVMVAAYRAAGENFGPEKPRLWSNVPLADVGVSSSYDVGSQPGRVIGIFDAEETKPDTHLRVLLNVGDELSRRTLARGKN